MNIGERWTTWGLPAQDLAADLGRLAVALAGAAGGGRGVRSERPAAREIQAASASGLHRFAAELTRRNVRTALGGAWTAGAVQNMLQRTACGSPIAPRAAGGGLGVARLRRKRPGRPPIPVWTSLLYGTPAPIDKCCSPIFRPMRVEQGVSWSLRLALKFVATPVGQLSLYARACMRPAMPAATIRRAPRTQNPVNEPGHEVLVLLPAALKGPRPGPAGG